MGSRRRRFWRGGPVVKLWRIPAFVAHYRIARRYTNPFRAAWIAQAFVRAGWRMRTADGVPPSREDQP